MAETRLPGRPKAALVKAVKRHLWIYLRSRPQATDCCWLQAWDWAEQCRNMSGVFDFSRKPLPWPSPAEIATQYLILVVSVMKSDRQVRVNRNAMRAMPAKVSLMLSGNENADVLKIEHAKGGE